MKFKYKIIWTNISKNKQEWCNIADCSNIAIFIAKQKVRAGMQNVLIQVIGEYGSDQDETIANAEIKEVEGEN